jgi:hypothetical protein
MNTLREIATRNYMFKRFIKRLNFQSFIQGEIEDFDGSKTKLETLYKK